jgi:Na+-transporting methylmalonyl-CoA/oxaloacetate decarboxylase gamma subunit
MNEAWSTGLFALVIGLTVVVCALGGLAFLTYGLGWLERHLKKMETKPVLKEEGVDPKIVAAIVAAISATEKRRFRVRRIRYLQPDAGDETWQDVVRAQQMISRQVGRKV